MEVQDSDPAESDLSGVVSISPAVSLEKGASGPFPEEQPRVVHGREELVMLGRRKCDEKNVHQREVRNNGKRETRSTIIRR